jgi:hypothetical protein
MKVYHGSTEIVEHPTILYTQRLLDFGKGFYTTTNQEQAEKWALIKQKRVGITAKSFVTVYDIDDRLFESINFKVKVFHEANEEWLDFVVRNRRENINHLYDIVIGPVANDTLYQAFTLYETGILTKQETIVRLKIHSLFDQISFHNAEVLTTLGYIHYYEVR